MREEWLDKEKRYELRHELSEQMQNPQEKDTSECFSGECWNEQEKYGTIKLYSVDTAKGTPIE